MADSSQPPINTLRSTKTSYILQTFWNIYSWKKKVIIRLKLLLSWFFGVQFAILCHWFRHKGFDERTWFRWHYYHIIFVYLQLIESIFECTTCPQCFLRVRVLQSSILAFEFPQDSKMYWLKFCTSIQPPCANDIDCKTTPMRHHIMTRLYLMQRWQRDGVKWTPLFNAFSQKHFKILKNTLAP